MNEITKYIYSSKMILKKKHGTHKNEREFLAWMPTGMLSLLPSPPVLQIPKNDAV